MSRGNQKSRRAMAASGRTDDPIGSCASTGVKNSWDVEFRRKIDLRAGFGREDPSVPG